jgi:hypothetical protein
MTNQNDVLEEKFVRISLLVGVIIGRLSGLIDSPYVSGESKKEICHLIDYIEPKINEIYYPEAVPIEKKICAYCNEEHKGTVNCKRRIIMDDPQVAIRKKAEAYAKEWKDRCHVCNKYHVGLEPCARAPNCS